MEAGRVNDCCLSDFAEESLDAIRRSSPVPSGASLQPGQLSACVVFVQASIAEIVNGN
jgi:hypothetical protein